MAKRKAADYSADSASFEESLMELQTIVNELEDGALGLEPSLARFERGIGLLRTCYSVLEAAEAKVEILTRFGGEEGTTTAPFEASSTLNATREFSDLANFDTDGDADSNRSSLF